ATVLPATVGRALFGPVLRRVATVLGRLLGGSTTVRRRLVRLGVDTTLEQYRVSQVLWGCAGFSSAAAILLLWSLRAPVAPVPGLVMCLTAFVAGVLLRENKLSADVRARERRMTEEFPALADLLALAVAAGEGPVGSLER